MCLAANAYIPRTALMLSTTMVFGRLWLRDGVVHLGVGTFGQQELPHPGTHPRRDDRHQRQPPPHTPINRFDVPVNFSRYASVKDLTVLHCDHTVRLVNSAAWQHFPTVRQLRNNFFASAC